MSSNLERRYRWLLRVLPAWYRAEREEEMVGIFLVDRDDGTDLEHGWPGWGEAGATVGLAVRVRFRARSRAGDVARLLASAGLVGQVVLAAQGAVSAARSGAVWSPWYDAVVVAAFAALVSGRVVWARWLVVVLAALGAVAVGWSFVAVAPVWVAAAAVWLGYHREAPPVARARWVGAAVAGAFLGAASAWVLPLSLVTWVGAGLITTAVVVAFRPWAGGPGAASAPAG
ncbi:hypothetical protein [Actinosynnema sp. NPDC023587]|uniref:hypothetical protein n=1 Tax=Actinosynnema sp. NPDC023587 TaxID=3154695 RepID=UPI0033DD08B4